MDATIFLTNGVIRMAIGSRITPENLALLLTKLPETELTAVGALLAQDGLACADEAANDLRLIGESLAKASRK